MFTSTLTFVADSRINHCRTVIVSCLFATAKFETHIVIKLIEPSASTAWVAILKDFLKDFFIAIQHFVDGLDLFTTFL